MGGAASLLCHAASLMALMLVPRPVPPIETEMVPVELVSLATATPAPAKESAAPPAAAAPSSQPPPAPVHSAEMTPPSAPASAAPRPSPPTAPEPEAALMPFPPPLPVMPPKARPRVSPETPRATVPVRTAAPPGAPPSAPSATVPVAEPTLPVEQAAAPASVARQVDAALAQEALGRYESRLHVLIAAHKSYPTLALMRGEKGTVTLFIALEHDGKLVNVTARSNASSLLVAASIQAVKAAAPFPPFPEELVEPRATFEVPITFKLQ